MECPAPEAGSNPCAAAATAMAPPPPPSLMEELVEEILLRLPPQKPASLVRAGAVCKPWRRLVCSPRFRRRFLELHRKPPMLGFICDELGSRCGLLRTTAPSPLQHDTTSRWWRCTLDARHGRVLLQELGPAVPGLVVWDPITDQQWVLPHLPGSKLCHGAAAAVLCAASTAAAGGGGGCDHRGCHRGPFLVVFVGTERGNVFVCTYSSDSAAWSDPIYSPLIAGRDKIKHFSYSPSVLLGNELYFDIPETNTVLKYDLELHQTSWVQLPPLQYHWQSSMLVTTEDGELRLVSLLNGKLCFWFRMDTLEEANAGWTQFKVIDLRTLIHVRDGLISIDSRVVGFADGLGIVFVTVNAALYTVDLETYMMKKIYRGTIIKAVFPYMRFYTPALEAASICEKPSAVVSSA